MTLISALLLFFGIASFNTSKIEATVTTDSTQTELSFDSIKRHYEERNDLESLLAYGKAVELNMLDLDSIRTNLQKRFFLELAKEAGKEYQLKWNILYGLWRRESEINPSAKGDGKRDTTGKLIPGSFKAFGLGQVHLGTARAHYDPDITKEELMDPIKNGFASAKILRDYTDIFGGNIKYGISAYQQGPANTLKQFNLKIEPKNISYVIDVLQYAAEVDLY